MVTKFCKGLGCADLENKIRELLDTSPAAHWTSGEFAHGYEAAIEDVLSLLKGDEDE